MNSIFVIFNHFLLFDLIPQTQTFMQTVSLKMDSSQEFVSAAEASVCGPWAITKLPCLELRQ